MPYRSHRVRTLLSLASAVFLAACGTNTGGEGANGGAAGSGGKPGVTPETGATDFLSADPNGPRDLSSRDSAGESAGAGTGSAAPVADGAGGDARTVERGDIYKVLPDHRILNLNSYRGVQVIDVTNPDAPVLEGRLAVSGTPVEMYVVGERAIVLLNNWQGYYGSRDDVRVESVNGGLVMVVDISDRSAPVLLDQAIVPGYLQTSRLTQGGGKAALYVAAQLWEQYSNNGVATSSARTVIKSFDASGDQLAEMSELDLGGYVTDIQATTDHMMVARQDYTSSMSLSIVGLVDISSPDGTMVQGDDVKVAGYVANKFNMDITGNVLRVVSGSQWGSSPTNQVETFDITNLQNVTAIDRCNFGDGQNLFATLFVGDKAFFVTYLRQDPFHAFSIDAAGHCAEQSQFVVSGWNDFFRTVAGDTRLIGIGRNDEASTSKLAVSLYDITNLSNANPLLARADIDLTWGYSEASWDDRAFSIIEDAVSVDANGTEETGLVLLPFEGWDEKGQTYVADVQLFTFSDHTLTQRGSMSHGTAVRRSFLAEPSVAANLSEDELSLFDTSDPNAPAELGRLPLAPNFTQVFVVGDYVARVSDRNYYWYGASSGKTPAPATVEIVSRKGDIDANKPVASFAIPSGARLYQVGDLLVSVLMTASDTSTNGVPDYDTDVLVTDVSTPTAPKMKSALHTTRIKPGYIGGYYGGYYGGYPGDVGLAADCFDCGGRYYGGYDNGATFVVGEALVFAESTSQQKSLGFVHQCYEYPEYAPCMSDSAGNSVCPDTYYSGGVTCSTPRGGETLCSGEFYLCSNKDGSCEPATPPKTTESCSDYEEFRYWTSYTFEVLDLSDPSAPELAPTVTTPITDEGTSIIVAGDNLYFNYQKPYDLDDDPRPFVKHYFRLLDVSDPAAPALSKGVNVPGDVIAADGDVVFTRDLVWDENQTETMLARLRIQDDLAYLKAQHLFEQRTVSAVQLDGAGHILVSHDGIWNYYGQYRDQNPVSKLSMLSVASLAIEGETEIDTWATFTTAKAGRAVFSLSGGLLVVDTSDASKPHAQAYFPTQGYWSRDIVLDGSDLIFAAGPYGLYRFDADTFNLLQK